MMTRFASVFALGLLASTGDAGAAADEGTVPVGAAVVDVTPSYPIRLMGYGNRKTESEGVASPLKVRALAIGADARGGEGEGPAVLIAVDNCAVGAFMTEELARRLKPGIRGERLVICA